MPQTTILDNRQIEDRLKRIAYQIYEDNVDEEDIIIAGIESNGFIIAKKIAKILKKISAIKVTLCNVKIDKKNPIGSTKISLQESDYIEKSIVLIDDVLNSGSTLLYGVQHFLNVPLKQFRTVVLVDRSHKKYPIKADFKGISLSTSLNEHVEVNLKPKQMAVFLK